MKNHQSHPTRFESFPNVNAISSQTRGRGWERDCGGERNPWYRGSYSNNSQKMKASLHHQKWNNTKWNNIEAKQENGKRLQDKPPKNHENNCYRCGIKGYWSRTCRTPKHLVDLWGSGYLFSLLLCSIFCNPHITARIHPSSSQTILEHPKVRY